MRTKSVRANSDRSSMTPSWIANTFLGYMGMEPLGITCPKAAARDTHALCQRSPMPKHMAFSGSNWMLDLHHIVQPVHTMEFARMRWALEHMLEKQRVNKVLGKVVVRAESVPGKGGFKDLQSFERDADIDAIVLAF